MDKDKIRNFSIIAHIDHGKSTLADRILEFTGHMKTHQQVDQVLDTMELEKERGITIKLNAVQLKYRDYILHLIDTPGHVDFSYEVSRSLAACEGVLLVVDAAQGIEAQTLANVHLAMAANLVIIPVINKIDLPNADVVRVTEELKTVLGFKTEEIIAVSAKTGEGIETLLRTIIERIPAPTGLSEAPLKALIFDSYFDSFRGVIILVRVMTGNIKVGDEILLMNSKATYEVLEVGVKDPTIIKKESLIAGEVGWLSASIKAMNAVKVGDTITLKDNPTSTPLPGYQEMKPMVFCGLYPLATNQYVELREALIKLSLNDGSFSYEPETSVALGFGFRCGFLGLLHLEIIKARLEREYKLTLIITVPNVVYEVLLTDGKQVLIDNPTKLPPLQKIDMIKEPYVRAKVMVPATYIGPILDLCEKKRGIYLEIEYLDGKRVNIHYELPLAEIVYAFYDELKSKTKGYASFDYEMIESRPSALVKMDILINGELVDALSLILHRDQVASQGRLMVDNLKELIPRQQFEVPLQAVVGSKVMARADIKAIRKNVLAKCYGGDISRKRKLLEKQKAGKKRMKMVGNVAIPPDAFLALLKSDQN